MEIGKIKIGRNTITKTTMCKYTMGEFINGTSCLYYVRMEFNELCKQCLL